MVDMPAEPTAVAKSEMAGLANFKISHQSVKFSTTELIQVSQI